jgi:hypothetical protein
MFTFPVGEHRSALILGGFPAENFLSALDLIDGVRPPGNDTVIPGHRFEVGHPYDLNIKVITSGDQAHIDITLDGEPFLQWAGPQSSLSVSSGRVTFPANTISISASGAAAAKWHGLTLTPFEGASITLAPELHKHTTPVASSPLLPETPLDLLPLVEVNTDSLSGSWLRNEKGIQPSPNSQPNRQLMLPVHINGDYRLRVRFTPVTVEESTNIFIPVGNEHHVDVIFHGWPTHTDAPISGLSPIKGKMAPANETKVPNHNFSTDTSYLADISVSTDNDTASIDVLLDDEPCFQWSGPLADLNSLGKHSGRVPVRGLILGNSNNGATRYEQAELTMTTGEAVLLRQGAADDPGAWVETLPLVDPEKHAKAGQWKWDSGQNLESAPGDSPRKRLYLPVAPAGDYAVAAEFTLVDELQSMGIALPLKDSRAVLNINCQVMGRMLLGLMKISGANYSDENFPPSALHWTDFEIDQTYRLVAHVAFDDENQARIRATLNGRPAIDWQGPITDFASPGFDWPRISVGYL